MVTNTFPGIPAHFAPASTELEAAITNAAGTTTASHYRIPVRHFDKSDQSGNLDPIDRGKVRGAGLSSATWRHARLAQPDAGRHQPPHLHAGRGRPRHRLRPPDGPGLALPPPHMQAVQHQMHRWSLRLKGGQWRQRSKSCEWGLLLRRETGRPTSRSAFVQVVGLAHYPCIICIPLTDNRTMGH